MVRNKFLNIIYNAIANSERFEQTDFNIITTDDRYSATLVLIYLPNPIYTFELSIPKKTSENGYSFSGNSCPGLVSFKEDFSFTGSDKIPDRISAWLKFIWEELTIDPSVREIEKERNDINKLFDQTNIKEDKVFDKKEVEDLKSRLTDLENKFVEELRTNVEDKGKLDEELKELKKDFETLRTTLNSLKKSGWAKTFYSKVSKWTKKGNINLLEESSNIVIELLPNNSNKAVSNI